MKKNESIRHIMSSDIISADVNAKISSVKHLMEENQVHHVPVVSATGRKLLGMISGVDILKVSFSGAFIADNDKSAEASLDENVKLEDIMTKNVTTIKDTDTVRHAAELLGANTYNSLVVINADEEVVGIVTSKDLINYLQDQY
jgi:CBS domain-containing protein